MTMMVTGHRKIVPAGWTGNAWPEANNIPIIQHHILVYQKIYQYVREYALKQLSAGKVPVFISGMALGADQLFATAVINLIQEGISRKLIAAVPFAGQEGKWPEKSKEVYRNLINHCSEVKYVSEPGYAAWKMQTRNCWMVDSATYVLAVWNGETSGGTWNCLSYAKTKGVVIHQLNPSYPERPIQVIK